MAYPADFTDAHHRHWQDAELLFANGRWPNADQLYGFSAECGLKTVMQALGMPVDPTTGNPAQSAHRKHVQDLWPEFAKFVAFTQGRKGGRYLHLLPGGKPFASWSHHDRYVNRRSFPKQDVEQHQKAARGIRRMVRRAIQDGLL